MPPRMSSWPKARSDFYDQSAKQFGRLAFGPMRRAWLHSAVNSPKKEKRASLFASTWLKRAKQRPNSKATSSHAGIFCSRFAVRSADAGKSSKHQAPSTREAPIIKYQAPLRVSLELDAWNLEL